MRWLALTAAAALLAASLSACSSVNSTDIATADIYPRVYLESYQDGTAQLYVTLLYGVANSVELHGGDSLTVSHNGGSPVALTQQGADFYWNTTYRSSLSGVAPGDTLVVSLHRSNHVDAPATRIDVPPAFSYTPPSTTTFTYDQKVPVSWAPGASSDTVAARFDVRSCSNLTSDETAGMRQLVGAPDRFPASDGSAQLDLGMTAVAGTCTVDLRVGRAQGTIQVDPAFDRLSGLSAALRMGSTVTLTFKPAP